MEIQRRLKRLKIQSEKLVDTFFSGDYRSIFKGPGLEFHEVRPYVPGDDTRFIDWNVSSRMGAPYCKVFREERELILTIVLDVSASMRNGFNLKKAAITEEIFALLGLAASANGDRVGSIAFSEKIEFAAAAKRGQRHMLSQIKNILSLQPAAKGSDLRLALRTAGEMMKRRGICIIISDFKAENYWRELSLMARRHDIVAIRIEDIMDIAFPSVGYLSFGDPEEGGSLAVYARSKRFRREYAGFWETQRSSWRKNCHKRGVETLTVSTEDDAAARLLTFFKWRHGK